MSGLGARLYKLSSLYAGAVIKCSQIGSPQVRIEPYEDLIDTAVKVIQKVEPGYFMNVEVIRIGPSSASPGAFGYVSSDEPGVLNVNTNLLKSNLRASEDKVIAAACTIAHERGHEEDRRSAEQQRQGKPPTTKQEIFPGGEPAAEREEQRIRALIEQRMGDIVAMPEYQKYAPLRRAASL